MLPCDTFVVGGDEAQNVLMSQHDGLVDVSLAKPRPLVPGGEDLHGYVLSSPLPSPHLAIATFPDGLLQNDGPCNGPLHQQGEAYERDRLLQACTINFQLPPYRFCSVMKLPDPEPEVVMS